MNSAQIIVTVTGIHATYIQGGGLEPHPLALIHRSLKNRSFEYLYAAEPPIKNIPNKRHMQYKYRARAIIIL